MDGETATWFDDLVGRCTFPAATEASCAFSGGADSTALIVLARHAGLAVTAHHVDHGLRPESAAEAEHAGSIADSLGVPFVLHHVDVEPGPNLEARARRARLGALPTAAMTAHTADDQAETVLLRLLRGSGSAGLAAIAPGPTHPLLGIRRSETVAVCAAAGVEAVHDTSNDRLDVWRNRIRHEVLPLLDDIAARDLVPILGRTADHLRADDEFLDHLARAVDPTDATAVAEAPPVLARRALRRWLGEAGYPPDTAAIERVLDVARGRHIACELTGGRRVERSAQRLRIVEPAERSP